MNAANDEDMIRMAFRVLDKDGSGTISAKSFTHLMTHIGNMHTGVEPEFRDCTSVQDILRDLFQKRKRFNVM